MPISIDRLAENIDPRTTVLLFGAGSSIPSGAPSVKSIVQACAKAIDSNPGDYSLEEITGLLEQKKDRKTLVETVRFLFKKHKPTGGLLNLPIYDWRNIYTTNYDELIEKSYQKAKKPLSVYSSNFDFTVHATPEVTKLFKLHGTIGKDECDGIKGRLILTENDNDLTEDYREALFDQFRNDLHNSKLLIIGHSLADRDIKDIVNRAIKIGMKSGTNASIYLLLFKHDEGRAELFESRGIRVCFGGIDEFFAAVAKTSPESKLIYQDSSNPLDKAAPLRPITVDVSHELETSESDFSSMFNGRPASYADIAQSLTFARTVTENAISSYENPEIFVSLILGAAGVGKTTAARQIIIELHRTGFHAWEHNEDHSLLPSLWLFIAKDLKEKGKFGVLFIDDTHRHLNEVNELIDRLTSDKNYHLKILLVSSKNHWNHRVKTPTFFKHSTTLKISKLSSAEITRLIQLIESSSIIQPLVEQSFGGFSRHEQRRRLSNRCESDFFVCLKNIFASERIDDIILREYASLETNLQEVYKIVAAMECAGVRVHRQLVMRVLGIPADAIGSVLTHLDEIIHEYTISERDGIYGWKGRHSVIVNLITKYKFSDADKFYKLIEKVISSISPTYEVEIRTIRELCNFEFGISKITNKRKQNTLLQKMISIAPGERVPRHRLIRNLIEMGEFEKAETEIRLFKNDLRNDGPIHRYRVKLLLARAEKSQGLMDEDRLTILDRAKNLAVNGMQKFPDYRNMLTIYCDVGLQYFKINGKLDVFDDAIGRMKTTEMRIGDPEITRDISRYERRVAGMTSSSSK